MGGRGQGLPFVHGAQGSKRVGAVCVEVFWRARCKPCFFFGRRAGYLAGGASHSCPPTRLDRLASRNSRGQPGPGHNKTGAKALALPASQARQAGGTGRGHHWHQRLPCWSSLVAGMRAYIVCTCTHRYLRPLRVCSHSPKQSDVALVVLPPAGHARNRFHSWPSPRHYPPRRHSHLAMQLPAREPDSPSRIPPPNLGPSLNLIPERALPAPTHPRASPPDAPTVFPSSHRPTLAADRMSPHA